ncbi:MAG: universal stress protein, partial [Alphaproteobacteria bacterium]|nr:universal stress protein [Alphaproteobacteria bacterium]
MTQDTFPKRIALATDLSHRCDRALDRALMVAKAWQAELTVIHALAPPDDITLFGSLRDQPSWRRPPDPVRKVRDRMFRDLVREDPNIDIAVHVEAGAPADVVLKVIRKSHAGDTPRRGDPDRQRRDPGGAAVAARPDRSRRARLSAVRPL